MKYRKKYEMVNVIYKVWAYVLGITLSFKQEEGGGGEDKRKIHRTEVS